MKKIIVLLLCILLAGCTTEKPMATLTVTAVEYLLIGESMKLDVVSSIDEDLINFQSSDETVATVNDEGIVLGISEDIVTIIITSQNGGSKEISITIIKDYVPETIKGVDVKDKYIIEDGPYQLNAVAYPEYKNQNFTWEVAGDNGSINKDTGEITFFEKGKVLVICRSVLDRTVFHVFTLNAVHRKDIEEINILFIGNSLTYRNDIPNMIKNMGRSTGKAVYTALFSPGKNTIGENYDKYFLTLVSLLEKNQYDCVILQEASADNFLNLPSFKYYAEKYNDLFKEHNVKEVFLYQTWAYREGCDSLLNLNLTRIEMQQLIIDAYDEVSMIIDAPITKVGEVFYNFTIDNPDIEFYVDDNHSTLAGSYLSSCMHYQSIFKENVTGNLYNPGLDQEIVEKIQNYVAMYFE